MFLWVIVIWSGFKFSCEWLLIRGGYDVKLILSVGG